MIRVFGQSVLSTVFSPTHRRSSDHQCPVPRLIWGYPVDLDYKELVFWVLEPRVKELHRVQDLLKQSQDIVGIFGAVPAPQGKKPEGNQSLNNTHQPEEPEDEPDGKLLKNLLTLKPWYSQRMWTMRMNQRRTKMWTGSSRSRLRSENPCKNAALAHVTWDIEDKYLTGNVKQKESKVLYIPDGTLLKN